MKPLGVMVILVAACGGGGNGTTDGGGSADAPPSGSDAGPVDAPVVTGPVSVSYLSHGVPRAGVTVYFQAADSTLVATAMTDASGSASATMPDGGFVTTVEHAGSDGATPVYVVKTMGDVAVDQLLNIWNGDYDASAHVTVSWPAVSGAASYTLFTSCSSPSVSTNTTSISTTLIGCDHDELLDVANMLVVATVGSAEESAYTGSVAVTDGSAIALTTPFTVDPRFVATVANIPANATEVNLNARVFENQTQVRLLSHSLPIAGGTATFSAAVPQIADTELVLQGRIQTPLNLTDFNDILLEPAGSDVFDATAFMQPQFASSPTFDVATHTMSWTEGSGGVQPLAELATFDVARTGAAPIEFAWTVARERHGTSLVLPVLPTDIADFNLTADDNPSMGDLSSIYLPPGGSWDFLRIVILAHSDLDAIGEDGDGQVSVDRLDN